MNWRSGEGGPGPGGATGPLRVWQFVLLVWGLTLVLISGLEQFSPGRGKAVREVPVAPPLRVAVFYEALCPDSRHFVAHQLLPAYEALADVIAVDLVPYGKATSLVAEDGAITFRCQHGPPECKANAVHACVAKHVTADRRRLDLVKCMINANSMKSDPIEVGRKCFAQYKEEGWAAIEKCSLGKEGEGLLYHLGKITHDLSPKVKFIPTITINDSQENQSLILRDLRKAVCNVYSGPKISACNT